MVSIPINQALPSMNSLGLISIILWFGLTGPAVYAAGLLGLLTPLAAFLIFMVAIIKIASYIKLNKIIINPLTHLEKVLFTLIFLQLALHSVGLFVPETAFDALWYHLPEAKVYANTGQIAKIPELLYSTMPRLGEMYLTLAMFSHSEAVVKLVSFIVSILFLVTCFFISRLILSRAHSLLVVIILASFPVIGWQSTSAYIDLPRALFELASLYCLIMVVQTMQLSNYATMAKWLLYSALLTGFALSTKLHSLTHLLAISMILIVYFWTSFKHKYRLLLVTGYWFLVALVASPWYLDNYLNSGHPLFPLNLQEKRLDQLNHAGVNSLHEWVSQQFDSPTHHSRLPFPPSPATLPHNPPSLPYSNLAVTATGKNTRDSFVSWVLSLGYCSLVVHASPRIPLSSWHPPCFGHSPDLRRNCFAEKLCSYSTISYVRYHHVPTTHHFHPPCRLHQIYPAPHRPHHSRTIYSIPNYRLQPRHH
jgi:hypothetical protein